MMHNRQCAFRAKIDLEMCIAQLATFENEISGVELKSLGNEARRKFSPISNLQIAAFR